MSRSSPTGSRSRSPTGARTSTRSRPTPTTTSTSTTRVTPTPNITYRWTFTNHYRSGNTFLYNTGVVNTINDPTLNFYQTYNLDKIVGGSPAVNVVSNALVAPSDVGQASMPNYAALRDQAITSVPTGWQDVRRPGRRPVLPRPARVRPALRRQPQGGRPRHARRLQRQHHRAAGSQDRAGARRRRQQHRRRLEHDRAPEPDAESGRHAHPDGQLRAGLAPRQPVGERGRGAGRRQGQVQRLSAVR